MSVEKSTIKIFCRVKPSPGPTTPYNIISANHESEDELLQLSLKPSFFEEMNINPFNARTSLNPTTNKSGQYVKHRPEQYSFRFAKVFDKKANQDFVFSQVAAPVIDRALQGYNGTVFAYGQTGSGKTYTMTGSREVYEQRGIIPRTLEYIFQRFQQEKDTSKIRNVFISYLEIYNECGYDLLNTSSVPGILDDLGKVTIMEDGNKEFNLRNLSIHSIDSVEEAIHYLYLGDHNRTVAETPFNEASTRSHCIFTIYMTMRDLNSELTCRSKLNLVDLAGSERIANSTITGPLLTEARHINLALHYLEQVIVALSDSNRTHVPYRNSMMTSVLRDSLGGNCMTTMIATLSLEGSNVQETLATCRFAQRVALITNTIVRNEDLDPSELIAQLKQEVKNLKEAVASGAVKPLKEKSGPLDVKEIANCQVLVDEYLNDPSPNAVLPISPDVRLIQECFRLLKLSSLHGLPMPTATTNIYNCQRVYCSESSLNNRNGPLRSNRTINDQLTLASTLARRDIEIKVLMDMLKIEKKRSRKAWRDEPTTSDGIHSDENHNPVGIHRINSNERVYSDSALFLNKVGHSHRLTHKLTEPDQIDAPSSQTVASGMDLAASSEKSFQSKVGHTRRIVRKLAGPGTNSAPSSQTAEDLPPENSDVPEAKKNALLSFMETYPGTSSMEASRSRMLKRMEKVEQLEKVINSYYANIEQLKSIVNDNKDFKSPDLPNVKRALIAQKKILANHEAKYKKSIEQVRIMDKNLKIRYDKLMVQFEKWWSENEHLITSENNEAEADVVDNFRINMERDPMVTAEKYFNSNSFNESEFDHLYDHSPDPPPPTPITEYNPQLHDVPTHYQTYSNESDRTEPTMINNKILPLTGDPETDGEIIKFIRTRQQISRQMFQSPSKK